MLETGHSVMFSKMSHLLNKLLPILILAVLLSSCGEDRTEDSEIVENRMTIYFQFVNGLTEDAPVVFRGKIVGKVESIEFVGKNADSVAVGIHMNEPDFRVHCTSSFLLGSDGLMGGMRIEITPAKDSSVCHLKKGSRVSGMMKPDLSEQIIADLKMSNTGELNEKLKNLFSDSTKASYFKRFLKNLDSLSFPVEQNAGAIKTQIANLRQEIDSLDAYFEKSELSPIIKELKKQYKGKSDQLDSLKAKLSGLGSQSKELKLMYKKLKTDFDQSKAELKELINDTKNIFNKDSLDK